MCDPKDGRHEGCTSLAARDGAYIQSTREYVRRPNPQRCAQLRTDRHLLLHRVTQDLRFRRSREGQGAIC